MNHEQDFNTPNIENKKNKSYSKNKWHFAQTQKPVTKSFTWEKVRQNGIAFCLAKQWEQALTWLEAAFFHFPENPDTTFLLALTQARLGLKNESISTSKTLDDDGPQCIKTRLCLCWLSIEVDDVSRAHTHLTAAKKWGTPSDHLFTLQLRIYLYHELYETALALCKEAQHQFFPHKNKISEILNLLSLKAYDSVSTSLFELFLRQLRAHCHTDGTPGYLPPTATFYLSPIKQDLFAFIPKKIQLNQRQALSSRKNKDQFQRLRTETDLRKRFWIAQRLRFREKDHSKIFETLSSSDNPSNHALHILFPAQTKPDQHSSLLTFTSPLTVHPPISRAEPFQSYSWLKVRQPWNDERIRLQRLLTSINLLDIPSSNLWVLTTSHPERMVGFGVITATSKAQGRIVVSVNPLIAFHRQETKLFITLIQESKKMGLTRLNAIARQDSQEERIIRRNGFRVVRQEETWEHTLAHLDRCYRPPTSTNTSSLPFYARRFMEEDWNQMLELIQTDPLNRGLENLDWNFPNDIPLHPSSFNPKLSSVVAFKKEIVGMLLVKESTNSCLHILLKTFLIPSRISARSITGLLVERFVPLAIKQGFTTVRFKLHIGTNEAKGRPPKWRKQGKLILKTRVFSREEISP